MKWTKAWLQRRQAGRREGILELEQSLRAHFRREEPRPGFAQRVAAGAVRQGQQAAHRPGPAWWTPRRFAVTGQMAFLMALLIAGGFTLHRHLRQQRREREAAQQLSFAINLAQREAEEITSATLSNVLQPDAGRERKAERKHP